MRKTLLATLTSSVASLCFVATAAATPGVPYNGRVSFGPFYGDTNGASTAVGLNSDGRFAVYTSAASNITSPDSNFSTDVFRYDRLLGITLIMSSASGSNASGNGNSTVPGFHGRMFSSDGRYVLFNSTASNLLASGVDSNSVQDAFLRDTDGFGSTTRVSLKSQGVQINVASTAIAMSANAQKILFSTASAISPLDFNGKDDLYVYDRVAQLTTLVSSDSAGKAVGAFAGLATLSDNGNYVAFTTVASLVPADNNNTFDVYWKDINLNQVKLVSSSAGGAVGNASSFGGKISGDGNSVAFDSTGTNFLFGAGGSNVFVKRIPSGAIVLATSNTSGGGYSGSLECGNYEINSNGSAVALDCNASNLVTGDTNGVRDVFVKNLSTFSWTLVSKLQGGVQSNGASFVGGFSDDSNQVIMTSSSNNFSSPDANGVSDAFTAFRQ